MCEALRIVVLGGGWESSGYQLLSDLRYLSGDFLHHHGSYENANGNQWPPQFGMMRDDYDSD